MLTRIVNGLQARFGKSCGAVVTILQPCNNCGRRKNCQVRDARRASLRGLGLTVAKFSCYILKADFAPGARVIARLLVADEDRLIEREFLGTAMRWKGRKVLIHLDTGESTDGRYEATKRIVKIWPARAVPLPEPPRKTCKVCGLPSGAVIEDWSCGCQPNQSFAETFA